MRKTAIITIDADGRDKGKQFFLREMPADRAERWAMRAMFLLARGNAEMSALDPGAGMAGIAAAGFEALKYIPYEDAAPLLNEMLSCVQYQTPANTQRPLTMPHPDTGEGADIEEVSTYMTLRKEIFKLHVNFLTAAKPLNGAQEAAAAGKQ